MSRSILKIRTYPDPALRAVNTNVTKFDKELLKLCSDMIHTLNSVKAYGLAAPQIGVNKNIIVVKGGKNPVVMVNPFVIESSSEMVESNEGCLSCPYEKVVIERPKRTLVRFQDVRGKENNEIYYDFYSIVLNHELSHLKGKLIIDYRK